MFLSKLSTYLILILLATFPLFANEYNSEQKSNRESLNGWNKAVWGMTKEQVISAFDGEVKKLNKPDEYDFNNSSGGGKYLAPIGIDDYEIGPMKCKVRFLFRDGDTALSAVVITSNEKNYVALESQYRELEKLLIEKYGKQSHSNDNTIRKGSKTKESTWNLSKSVIELEYSHIQNILSSLTLTYRTLTKSTVKNKL